MCPYITRSDARRLGHDVPVWDSTQPGFLKIPGSVHCQLTTVRLAELNRLCLRLLLHQVANLIAASSIRWRGDTSIDPLRVAVPLIRKELQRHE